MTHIAYFYFRLASKSFLASDQFDLLLKSVLNKRLKNILKKSCKNWEICFVPKSLLGEINFLPCFQLFKKNESGQLQKLQQVYLGEKEG